MFTPPPLSALFAPPVHCLLSPLPPPYQFTTTSIPLYGELFIGRLWGSLTKLTSESSVLHAALGKFIVNLALGWRILTWFIWGMGEAELTLRNLPPILVSPS